MPFTEPISSASGRNSRASNVSAITASTRSQAWPNQHNDTLASAGVMSMLKTSTDTGDIGALSFNTGRLPTMPRLMHHGPAHRAPRYANMRSAHRYATSQTSGGDHREWDAKSNARQGSLTSMQSLPVSLPPGHSNTVSFGRTTIEEVQAIAAQPISESSNIHQPHISRSLSQTHMMPTTRGNTLHNQARGTFIPRPLPPALPKSGPPQHTSFQQSYRRVSEYEPAHFSQENVPPRNALQPPPMPSGNRLAMLPYNNRSMNGNNVYDDHVNNHTGRVMPVLRQQPSMRQPPDHRSSTHAGEYFHPYEAHTGVRSASVVVAPPFRPHQPLVGPPSSISHGAPGNIRPGARTIWQTRHFASSQQSVTGRSVHPSGRRSRFNVGPAAHNLFHSAVRNARNNPQRIETPVTEGSLRSVEPPSSGTMPSASSPSTPTNSPGMQPAVDLSAIDPEYSDPSDSFAEPMWPYHYLEYAEALEKEIDEDAMNTLHSSVPPTSFVQRVQAILETSMPDERLISSQAHGTVPERAVANGPNLQDGGIHELAGNEIDNIYTSANTRNAAELPASPVRVAELADSSIQALHRITRELVKQELKPSDSVEAASESTHGRQATDCNDASNEVFEAMQQHSPGVSSSEDGFAIDANIRRSSMLPSASGSMRSRPSTEQKQAPASHTLVADSAPDFVTGPSQYLDGDTTADETQTKDAFMLDADTITQQHQRQKEGPQRRLFRRIEEAQDDATNASLARSISPLKSDDIVERTSIVSPLQTQVGGIDTTLLATSCHDQSESHPSSSYIAASISKHGRHSRDQTSGNSSIAFSTKLLPKASQHVQSTYISDATETSRLSFPQDSTIGDTSFMETGTEVVTDMAVRFSVPRVAPNTDRPQIVEIPPSSSPDFSAPVSIQPTLLTVPDDLRIESSSPENDSFPPSTTKLFESRRNNLILPPSFSNRQQAPSHTRSTFHLDDIKLFTQRGYPTDECKPSSDSKHGDRTMNISEGEHKPIDENNAEDRHPERSFAGFQVQPELRNGGISRIQERHLHESAARAKARRAQRHRVHTIAEAFDLPSLNFSRMDLIDKLNEALKVRSSRSMEVLRQYDVQHSPRPRPQSAELQRDRYMSFFRRPEEFSSLLDQLQHDVAKENIERPHKGPNEQHEADTGSAIPAVEIQSSTETDIAAELERPLSPEEFLNVASEINRLSIPSVTGLSDRLSGFLPNLRELQLDTILAEFAEAKSQVRPATVLSSRTSAGFRTLAERADEIVRNGTHDSMAQKDLPTASEAVLFHVKPFIGQDLDKKQRYLSGSVSVPTDLRKEQNRPPSSLINRVRPPTNAEEVRELLPSGLNPLARNPKRELISSACSRPWNQDENYPWAASNVDVDLSIQSEEHQSSIFHNNSGALRKTKSLDFTNTKTSGFWSRNAGTDLLVKDQTTQIPGSQTRKMSTRSMIGSITRKIGFHNGTGSKDTATIDTSSPEITAHTSSGASQAHRPGERYPTSGLAPPLVLNLDEVRSFFSDESSEEKEHRGSLRKRLTQLKAKSRGIRPEPSRCLSRSHSLDEISRYTEQFGLEMDRVGAHTSADSYECINMSKTEFRLKRIGEKLRHLVAKGSQLLRSWSHRSKNVLTRTDHGRED